MRINLVLIIVAIAACGGASDSSDSQDVPDVLIEAPGPNEFQLVLPEMTIEPGKEYEYCTWTDRILDEDMFVKGGKSVQSKMGHHVILFFTTSPRKPTTALCLDQEMATMHQAIALDGEAAVGGLPGDLAVKIPKGSQLIVNHHYLNPTHDVVVSKTALNVRYAPPGQSITNSATLTVMPMSTLRVAPGKPVVEYSCAFERDFPIWTLSPHMHERGVHVQVDYTSPAGEMKRFFDIDWRNDFNLNPPRAQFDPTNPFVLQKGGQLKVRCEWNNETGEEITFGKEMCIAFGQFVDRENVGNLACLDSKWIRH